MTRDAEDLGFDASLLAEHYYPSGSLDQYARLPISADAWMYLAALARETSTHPPGHAGQPGHLPPPGGARQDGRHARPPERRPRRAGHRRRLAGARARRLRLSISAAAAPRRPPRRAAAGHHRPVEPGPVLARGRGRTRCTTASFTPKPVQQPRPTIIVGGRTTSRRLPRLAARYADEFVIGQPTPDEARARARRCWTPPAPPNERDPRRWRCLRSRRSPSARRSAEVEQHMQTYRATNPQYVRMMDNPATWLSGTPADVRAQLDALLGSRHRTSDGLGQLRAASPDAAAAGRIAALDRRRLRLSRYPSERSPRRAGRRTAARCSVRSGAAALQHDAARVDRPHDAVVFDVAGDFAARQAGQLQPGDAHPLARLFVLSK